MTVRNEAAKLRVGEAKVTGVVSMEEEITNTKRQIDDIEWEGGHCDHLHKHLEHLIEEYMNGGVWYANF